MAAAAATETEATAGVVVRREGWPGWAGAVGRATAAAATVVGAGAETAGAGATGAKQQATQG